MAKIKPPTTIFCLFLLFFISVADAGSLSFTFPPRADIQRQGEAYFQGDDLIQLHANQGSANQPNSSGWAAYNKSIPLWNKSSRALANFSTHFQFTIGRGNDGQTSYGDGIAFFMAPFNLEQPFQTAGGGFGIFNARTYNGSFYQMVAVEFDTYKNDWDPDDNHVGIDVNSGFSKANMSLSNATATNRPDEKNLKNGAKWDAWVDYDGGIKQLQVFFLNNPSGNVDNISKPGTPSLSYDIDLREFLPSYIKAGLSASTGASIETHTVSFWNFSCQHPWENITPPPSRRKNRNRRRRKRFPAGIFSVVFISCFFAICLVFVCGQWYFNNRKRQRSVEAYEEGDVEMDDDHMRPSSSRNMSATANPSAPKTSRNMSKPLIYDHAIGEPIHSSSGRSMSMAVNRSASKTIRNMSKPLIYDASRPPSDSTAH